MTVCRTLSYLMVALVATACSSDNSASSTGSVQFIVVPEDTIPDGLQAGTGEENIVDGWTVTYSTFLVTIGNLKAARSSGGDTIADTSQYVLDLRNAPTDGYVIKEFKNVASARWDKFGFDLPNAKSGAMALPPTTSADLSRMVDNGYSIYMEGQAVQGKQSPISFRWGFKVGTSFADCATSDGLLGFAVPSGGTVQVKPTIHGDHQFFTNVTEGAEITERRAAWFGLCNKDGDGELTLDELKACDLTTTLVQKPAGPYDLTSVKDGDGDGKLSVYDYIDTQLRTLGDFQGDGECPTRARL